MTVFSAALCAADLIRNGWYICELRKFWLLFLDRRLFDNVETAGQEERNYTRDE